jgi:Na+/glutamate symporter
MREIISGLIIGVILGTSFTVYAIENNTYYEEQSIKYLEKAERGLTGPQITNRSNMSIAYSNLEILKELREINKKLK